MATLDAMLLALDKRTGELVWETEIADPEFGYSETVEPTVYRDKIISGAECGIRGFISAYDKETGELAWRWHTIPAPDEVQPDGTKGWYGNFAEQADGMNPLNRDIAAEKAAIQSGQHADAWQRRGGSNWMTNAIDAERGIVYATIGNPSPDLYAEVRPGDNRWTESLSTEGQVLMSLIAVALWLAGSGSSLAEERIVPSWMTIDAGAQKVQMDVVAGFNPNNSNWNFNGNYEGNMTVVVPEGWRVEITLTNRDGDMPHSLVVMADPGKAELPLQAGREQAAFPRAYSRSPERGISAGDQDLVSFQADKAGDYLLFCGVPGHGQSAMWTRFAVAAEADTAYMIIAADAEPGRT
jgi:sulfocyanin